MTTKDKVDIEGLKQLRQKIDNVDEFHHSKIFEIIKKNEVNYSKNKNGIFVNMNKMTEKTLKDIDDYLIYINKQEKTFSDVENIKKEFKRDFFDKIDNIPKQNKEIPANIIINNE
jgi:DNA repair ATPase RecN